MTDSQLPGVHDLVLHRGDDFARSFRFLVGAVVEDLTGTTWAAQVRESPDAAVVAAAFTVTVDPETHDQLTIALAGAVTGALPGRGVWDLQQLTPVLRTRLKGAVKVDPDVTR